MIVKNRVKKHSDFQKVINEGEVVRTNFFTSYIVENNLGYTRIGISVPKKTGVAVVRNKIKRQIRSAVASLGDYTKSKDYIFIVRKNYDINNYSEIENEVHEILKK